MERNLDSGSQEKPGASAPGRLCAMPALPASWCALGPGPCGCTGKATEIRAFFRNAVPPLISRLLSRWQQHRTGIRGALDPELQLPPTGSVSRSKSFPLLGFLLGELQTLRWAIL